MVLVVIVGSGIAALAGFWLLRMFLRGPSKGTDNPKRLDGRIVVITGSNCGIGAETAKDMAKRGAKVYMLCRNVESAEKTKEWILDTYKDAKVEVIKCDLGSLESVRDCAAELNSKTDRIDILINNAGVMMCPIELKTQDGFDMQFGTNHLGHFLLTELLLPQIVKSAKTFRPRIVNVSSMAHLRAKIDFDDLNFERRGRASQSIRVSTAAYGQSKLANVLHALALAPRLAPLGINTYSLHPGVIAASNLSRHLADRPGIVSVLYSFFEPLIKALTKRNIDGAQTTLYCALDDSLDNDSGKYYSDCKEVAPSELGRDKELAEKLYKVSREMVGLPPE